MQVFDIIAVLISLTALFSYVNYRFIKLPTTIALMLFAMALSGSVLLLDALGFNIKPHAINLLESIDFSETLLGGMLSFLLFAGAIHINLNDLAKQKIAVGLLATIGVTISTLIVGYGAYYILEAVGIHLPLIYCLLFGALISPTDPIAVLVIMKKVGVKKSLETKISCESLFNDGVGVVIFLVILGIATGQNEASIASITTLLLEEAVGGIFLGIGLGYFTYMLLKSVDNYQVEILLTLALVAGGYTLASAIHTSGPITIVVAGLLIGNQGRKLGMSEKTRQHLDTFWELIDEILVSVLFVLIGLEILLLTLPENIILASLLMIPLTLIARFIAVGGTLKALTPWRTFTKGATTILTWGGLRGGISVALALSLPSSSEREVILTLTYVVVAFSIIVQGLTASRIIPAEAKKVTSS